MTDQEINVAIARQMDFYIIQDGDAFSLRHGRETTLYPWYRTPEEAWCDAPEYITDLNAMYDAEGTLPNCSGPGIPCFYDYLCELERVCQREPNHGREFDGDYGWAAVMVCASAKQRAEAFLRVHGKWKE